MRVGRAAMRAAAWSLLLLAWAHVASAVDFAKQERAEHEVEVLAKTLQQIVDEGNFTTVDREPLRELVDVNAMTLTHPQKSTTCPDYWSHWTQHVSCMLEELNADDSFPQSWTGWVIFASENLFNIMFSKFILCESTFWFTLVLLTSMNVLSLLVLDEMTNQPGIDCQASQLRKRMLAFYRDWVLPWRPLVSGVVVLNIYQADWTRHSGHLIGQTLAENPVWCSIIFIIFEKTLTSWTALCSVKSDCCSGRCFEKSPPKLKREDLGTLAVMNRYQELTYPLFKLVCLFLVQSCLLMFYVLNLHESNDITDSGSVSCFKWLIGVGVVVIAGDDEMGQRFSLCLWFALNRATDKENRKDSDPASASGLTSLNREVRFRAFLSFVVNSAGLTFLRRTFPVILAESGPWDFIVDCMAIFFIVKLDDHEGSRTMLEELEMKEKAFGVTRDILRETEPRETELINKGEATEKLLP